MCTDSTKRAFFKMRKKIKHRDRKVVKMKRRVPKNTKRI